MITLILILFPLVAGLIVMALSPVRARIMAVLVSLVEFGIAAFLATQPQSSWFELTSMDLPWIKQFNAHFHLELDGISMVLILLTTFLVPLIIWSTPSGLTHQRPSAFFGLILFMQMALIGVFAARDAFLFYIFWELALIPIYFICLRWGG